MHETMQETIGRVNRCILAWPTDDALPAEGTDGLKSLHKKLVSGFTEIKTSSDRDVQWVDLHEASLSLISYNFRLSELLTRP